MYMNYWISNINFRKKANDTIPNKILKLAANGCYIALTDCINAGISKSWFPDKLKFADITPIHKKEDTTDKTNYRPIRILIYSIMYLK